MERNARRGAKYVSIGYLDQASRVVVLEPFEGYAQLELWTPGGEGGDPTFARRLTRINKEGKYVRIDTFRPAEDGEPVYLSTYYFTDADIRSFADRED